MMDNTLTELVKAVEGLQQQSNLKNVKYTIGTLTFLDLIKTHGEENDEQHLPGFNIPTELFKSNCTLVDGDIVKIELWT